MQQSHDPAPRALPRRMLIAVQVTSFELHLLIDALEQRAEMAAAFEESVDLADHYYERIAALREAAR
jgi:hypothetical protein